MAPTLRAQFSPGLLTSSQYASTSSRIVCLLRQEVFVIRIHLIDIPESPYGTFCEKILVWGNDDAVPRAYALWSIVREERSQVAREGHRKAEFGRETSRATVSVEKKVTLLVDHPKRHSQKSYQKKGGE